ncbi:NAD(P)H-dependent flavin oxidoreductase, partial [Chloroflexota bacterium]
MGTRFFASKECPAHPKIKERLLQLSETDTMIINRSINNMQRVIKTDLARKVLEMEGKGATLEEILPMIRGEKSRNASEKGDVNNAVITAGQGVGLIHDIPSVKEIIEGIISEAKLIVQRLHDQVASG